jgi:hypothetical protein
VISLPVRALLRCKAVADLKEATTIGPEFAPTRMLVGYPQNGPLEMWFAPSGKWRESGEPHPLDIVGFVNPDGSLRPLTTEFSP